METTGNTRKNRYIPRLAIDAASCEAASTDNPVGIMNEVLETLMDTQQLQNVETGQELPGPVVPQLTGKRANWTIAHKVDGEVIKFAVKGAGELKLEMGKVSQKVKDRAAIHGLVQRVSDAAAMARDPKTGMSATPQEKFEAMRRLVEHYSTGSEDWSPVRNTEGVGRPRTDRDRELLVVALSIFNPEKTLGTLEEFVKGLKKEQVAALLVSAQLKECVEKARETFEEEAKKVSAGVDAEELLKGL